MRSSIEKTGKLLDSYAKKLSHRADCRRVEYVVTIRKDGEVTLVTGQEYIKVVERNPYRRVPIIQHAISQVSNTYQILNDFMASELSGCLIPGTYVYKLSSTKKSRRWSKVEIDGLHE